MDGWAVHVGTSGQLRVSGCSARGPSRRPVSSTRIESACAWSRPIPYEVDGQ